MKLQIYRYIQKYISWLWSLPSAAKVEIRFSGSLENKNTQLTLEFIILFSTYFTNGFWKKETVLWMKLKAHNIKSHI